MRQKKVVLRACNVAIVTPIVRKIIKTWSEMIEFFSYNFEEKNEKCGSQYTSNNRCLKILKLF